MLESNLTSTPVLFGEIQREILDVRKEEQDKVVEPTLDDIMVKPDSAMQTLGSVLVKGVTANIDESIKPENIKLGTTILGVQGNVAPDKPDQEKMIYPSEEEQIVVADTGFELAKVIAKPVETESFEIAPSTSEQVVKAGDGKYIKEVKVGAIEDIDPELTDQETKLAKLEEDVNALSDKPTDMLQARVDGDNSCRYLFYYYGGTSLDISRLDTSNVTNMANMFNHCEKLTSLDPPNWNTSNVTNMSDMFVNCIALTSLDVSSFNTSKVTNMSEMFYSCIALTSLDVSSFNTSKVTNMSRMFSDCRELTSLDVSNFDTSAVTNMQSMFNSCHVLTKLDLSNFNTSSVTNMSSMFGGRGLTELDLSNFNTSKVTSMSNMFNGCPNLENIVGKLDMQKCTSVTNMFYSCQKLTDVTLLNIKKSLQMGSGTSYGTNLSNETLINTIQQLWDLTGATSQTLTLSTTSKENITNIYVKLVDVTDEMLAEDENVANKKPCVVCEPTDEGAMTLTEYATSKNWAIA